jgi:hypothetical protein
VSWLRRQDIVVSATLSPSDREPRVWPYSSVSWWTTRSIMRQPVLNALRGVCVCVCLHCQEKITPAACAQVQHVDADNPSGRMWAALRGLFPQLITLSLDTVHLAMAYEFSTYRRRTPGSRFLRLIMSRFHARGVATRPGQWNTPFTGNESRPLTRVEEHLREQLRARSMSKSMAERIFNDFDASRPFESRAQFIESIAALTALFGDEVEQCLTCCSVVPCMTVTHSSCFGRSHDVFTCLDLMC